MATLTNAICFLNLNSFHIHWENPRLCLWLFYLGYVLSWVQNFEMFK